MDDIVIGSGPNGLAAAIRLAEAGRSVLVLEAADRPGGAVQTEELTLPGFHHDTFSAVHPAAAASPVFARMPLEDHGLRWVHPEACFAHPLPGGRAVLLYRDLAGTAMSLDRQSPGDGERWTTFVEPWLRAYPAVRDTMLAGYPPVAGPLKLLRARGPSGPLGFAAIVPQSARSLARQLFSGSDSCAWLYGAATHNDVPPHRAGSAVAAFYLNLLGHAVGWPSAAGGAGRLTDALTGYLRTLGGTIRTGARVVGIQVTGGRVWGVRLADGERLAARTVIADVMPHALVAMVDDTLPAAYRALVRKYVYGPATLKVDWALDGPIPWSAPEVGRAGTIHLGGDEATLLQSVEQARHELPERPYLLVGQQSLADPLRAPPGKHTAWAYTHGPREAIDWAAQTARHVERMEEQVERFAPGFRDRILARHVLGPDDMEARNANLVGGDVGGGSYRLRQTVFRPMPKLSPYKTPVKGLFLGSAAAFPGGAVHGVPGDAAARVALRHNR
jgi:phytoene dehydrogenase-like protein